MYLIQYLEILRDQKKTVYNDTHHENSGECLVNWWTVFDTKPLIVEKLYKFLKYVNDDYQSKFNTFTANPLTRIMFLIGLVIGPLTPIPVILADSIIFLSLLTVYISIMAMFYIPCGVFSLIIFLISCILAGLGWIVGGINLSSSIFDNGNKIITDTCDGVFKFTEDFLKVIMKILRIPAGILSLIMVFPSSIPEIISETFIWLFVSSAYYLRNFIWGLSENSENPENKVPLFSLC